ncbi:hypothetical protein [Leptospira ryugenii]|uniref:hypothetical protein n=1 Tax=Leptospira ryugenii TaxID=1917863 RepID=UPI000D59F5AE|nr:hypothetical protein [Leptospira ryugenii]
MLTSTGWFREGIFCCAFLILFSLLGFQTEAIYYYHFGEVTNSDALYPYLFGLDLHDSIQNVRTWNFPPSSTWIPDVLLLWFVESFTSNLETLFNVYLVCVLYGLVYFLRVLGLHFLNGVFLSFSFLLLGVTYPREWGQFFLPSFHGMEFLMMGILFHQIKIRRLVRFREMFLVSILFSLFLQSELWLFVHFVPFLALYFLFTKRIQSGILILILTLVVFLTMKKWERMVGLGSFQTHQLGWQGIFLNLMQLPTMALDGLRIHLFGLTSVPLSEYMFPMTTVLAIFMFVLYRKLGTIEPLLLTLSIFLTLLFLICLKIEMNARYLYSLPIVVLYCPLFLIQNILSKYVQIIAMSLLLLFSYLCVTKIEPINQQKISAYKEKFQIRMECLQKLEITLSNEAVFSEYWLTKYSRAYSQNRLHLVPFTPDGIYYPWVHNTKWDQGLVSKEISSFRWKILRNPNSAQKESGILYPIPCLDWQIIGPKIP